MTVANRLNTETATNQTEPFSSETSAKVIFMIRNHDTGMLWQPEQLEDSSTPSAARLRAKTHDLTISCFMSRYNLKKKMDW